MTYRVEVNFVDWVKGWHLVSVAVIAVIAVYAVARLLDNTQSTYNIENAIRGELAQQVDTNRDNLTVDCPETVEWEANESFHCIVDDAEGNRARVTVHMESGDGEYTWAVE